MIYKMILLTALFFTSCQRMGQEDITERLKIIVKHLDEPELMEASASEAVSLINEMRTTNQSLFEEYRVLIERVLNKVELVSQNNDVLNNTKDILNDVREAEYQAFLQKEADSLLFDGQSFEGWEGNLEYFRIEDSAIVAGFSQKNIPQNEYLCNLKSFKNFEMKLKFKMTGAKETANAGIQFRTKRIPDSNEIMGYQADIGQHYWGSLYDEHYRSKILYKADDELLKKTIHHNDWNEYTIRCIDNHIQLWLNDNKTVDYYEMESTIPRDGLVCLQIHAGPPMEIMYKDIRLKEIPQKILFKKHVINQASEYEAAGIFDVNNDGYLDIYCGGFWYEGPVWNKHFVRNVTQNEDGTYYNDFAAIPADVNDDGWTDVISGSWFNKDVFWIKNSDQSSAFTFIEIDNPGNLETLIGSDINGDGQLDILPNTLDHAQWYEYKKDRSGKHGVKWEKYPLPEEAAVHGIGVGDINKDGLVDIVTPEGWLEQINSGTDWDWHPEFSLDTPTSIPILIHDVDRDGDKDIIWGMGHDYGVFWLEQKPDGRSERIWEKHEIDITWSQAHYLLLADLDCDGEQELVTGKRHYAHNGKDPGGNGPVCVYYYKYDRQRKLWKRGIIHEGGNVGFGINTMADDLDGDGDIDIVCPGKSGLFWMENLLHR